MTTTHYPTPNDCGVYRDDGETAHVFETKLERSYLRIEVVEIAPNRFYTGHSFQYMCGNHHGSGGGVSGPEEFSTLEDAVEHERIRALKHFSPAALHPADSCVSEEQKRQAIHFTELLTAGWPLHNVAQLSLF
jgi:hypothetical protein